MVVVVVGERGKARGDCHSTSLVETKPQTRSQQCSAL